MTIAILVVTNHGVFLGDLAERHINSVVLHTSRRLSHRPSHTYAFYGEPLKFGFNTIELACFGVEDPEEYVVSCAVSNHEIFQVLEILSVTKEAENSLGAIKEHKI